MEVNAVVGRDFLPMLAGGVAAPLAARVIPGGGGPLMTGAVGLVAAIWGKGAVKVAGQGALLVSAVDLVAGLVQGTGKSADGFDF